MSQTEIRLDDLLARNIPIGWVEGVALVQAVCRVPAERGSNGEGFPSPADILLWPDGDVSVLRVATGENGAAAAAHLLAEMAGDTLPTQLRLVLSQATATQTGESLAEFSKALVFFERPDSLQLLQQLYVRASLAPSNVEGKARHPAEPSVREEAAAKRPALRRKIRREQVAVLAAVAALACAAAWYVAVGPGTERPLAAVGALRAMVREQLGIPPTNAAAAPVEKPSTVTSRGDRVSAPAREPRTRERARDYLARPISPVLRPEASGGTPVLQFPSDVTARAPVDHATVEISPRSATEADAFGAQGGTLYSATDPDVTPPRAIYPQLPSPATIRSSDTVVELIITADGLVESARLRSVPRNVIEIMLLSAAKAWRFQPARLDGSPVRFRHRVVITPEWNGFER